SLRCRPFFPTRRSSDLSVPGKMTEAATARPLYFNAVLHPHRSLGPRGFLILMLAVGLVSFSAGVAFAVKGAWPIVGFFGLDALRSEEHTSELQSRENLV